MVDHSVVELVLIADSSPCGLVVGRLLDDNNGGAVPVVNKEMFNTNTTQSLIRDALEHVIILVGLYP